MSTPFGRQQKGSIGPVRNESVFNLTPRELEILHFAALGLTNAEIGKLLFLSEETIKSHIRRILWKMDARNRVYAISLAWENHLLSKRIMQETRHRFLHSPQKPGNV